MSSGLGMPASLSCSGQPEHQGKLACPAFRGALVNQGLVGKADRPLHLDECAMQHPGQTACELGQCGACGQGYSPYYNLCFCSIGKNAARQLQQVRHGSEMPGNAGWSNRQAFNACRPLIACLSDLLALSIMLCVKPGDCSRSCSQSFTQKEELKCSAKHLFSKGDCKDG